MANGSNLAIYQVDNAVKVADALSAYLHGRVDPVVTLCADHVVWRSIAEPAHAPFGGTFYGRAGVRRFFGAMFSNFEISRPCVLDVIPAGDEVIHVLKLEAAKKDGTSSGAAFVVGRWQFKNGEVVAYTDYFDVAAAIQTSTTDLSGPKNLVTRDPSFAVYQIENAVQVSKLLAAYRGGRIGPILEALHPEAAWRSLSDPAHARFGGTFRGIEAVKTYFRRLADSLVLDEYLVLDVIPAGDEVVHVAEVHAHSTVDPVRTVLVRLVCIWTIEEGRVTSLTEYFDVPAYLAQLKAS